MDAQGFLKVVLDPRRLAVVGAIATQRLTAQEVADRCGQRPRDVLATLAPLVHAGIVAHDGNHYELRAEALRELAVDLPQPPPPARQLLFGMTEAEQAVLGRFFAGERLVDIPTQRAKRRVVLERLALEFEPGVRYAERDVNAVLRRYHDDYAALRRHLVDEGFLDRGEGLYWRSGGRV